MIEKSIFRQKYTLKLLLIFNFLLITVTMIILSNNSPATGYEISIYSSLSNVWICLIIVNCISILTIIFCVLFNQKLKHFWLFLITLIYSDIIMILLQHFQGYYSYTFSDPLHHLQNISKISFSGYIGENYYPISYVFGTIWVKIFSIFPNLVVKTMSMIYWLMFILFSCLLSLTLLKNKKIAILTLIASSVFIFSYFHLTFYPHILSLFSFPLIFYIYFKLIKTKNKNYIVLFLIMSIVMTFLHPLSAFILIICLIVIYITIILLSYIKKEKINKTNLLYLPIANCIIFILWISSFSLFGLSVQRSYNWLVNENVQFLSRAGELESPFTLNVNDFITLTVKMYGPIILYLSLTFLIIIICLLKFHKNKNYSLSMILLSTVFLASYGGYFILSMGMGLVTWGRLLNANIGMWATPIFISIALFYLFKPIINRNKILLASIGISAILVTASILSCLTLYKSSWILQPNGQVTMRDISGSEWFDENCNHNIEMAPMGWLSKSYHWIKVPDHFGYAEEKKLIKSIGKPIYIILTKRFLDYIDDPILNKHGMNTDPRIVRSGYESEDFVCFNNDKSVSLVYNNKEFWVYSVN